MQNLKLLQTEDWKVFLYPIPPFLSRRDMSNVSKDDMESGEERQKKI